MGTGPDCVLDPDLKVRGIQHLRVVDGSAMPDLTSAHTNSTILMIAEKGLRYDPWPRPTPSRTSKLRASMSPVKQSEIEVFERDGVVLIRSAFDAHWLDELETAVEDVMKNPSSLSREYIQTGNGRFFTDHHMSRYNDSFRRFMLNSPASQIAAALLRSEKLNLVDEHLLVKKNPAQMCQLTGITTCHILRFHGRILRPLIL